MLPGSPLAEQWQDWVQPTEPEMLILWVETGRFAGPCRVTFLLALDIGKSYKVALKYLVGIVK